MGFEVLPIHLVLIGGLLAYLLYLFGRRRSSALPNPPSPPGLPLLGNIFDLPTSGEWREYTVWARKLGSPIISMKILNTRLIILNDRKTVSDLLERRSAIYNGRPRIAWLTEAAGFDWVWAITQNMDRWKASRHEFEFHFKPSAIRKYHQSEIRVSQELLQKLLVEPGDFMEHCRYFVGSLLLDILYGINEKDEIKSFIKLGESSSVGMAKLGDRNLVNIFPFLRHLPSSFRFLPGMSWRKIADEFREMGFSMRDGPFAYFRERQEKHQGKPCVASSILERFQNALSDQHAALQLARDDVGAIYIGAFDTTTSALRFLILAFVLHPDVQKRAQDELDVVLGNSRLPDIGDEDNLPYITAICKELLRWIGSPTPPHCLLVDDIYEGYFLPKGSLIIGNTWALTRNEDLFPEPQIFRPERYLTHDGKLDPNGPEPTGVYGYGRRLCPGRFIAREIMWLVAARLLTVFNFKRTIGPDGKEIIPVPDVGLGIFNRPSPFPCVIVPRSEKAKSLILGQQQK